MEVQLTKKPNVATFQSAPGFIKHANFCQEASMPIEKEETDPVIANKTMIPDDEIPMIMQVNDADPWTNLEGKI